MTGNESQYEYLTVGQAARELGISESTVRVLPASDLPVAMRVGRRSERRYRREDVQALKERWKSAGGQPVPAWSHTGSGGAAVIPVVSEPVCDEGETGSTS